MESIIRYIWKYKLYDPLKLFTTASLPVIVINPGICNTDAGPDFLNAKIRVGETLWAGNVEIHVRASDWFRHNHHGNPAYNEVVLHVVAVSDAVVCRESGLPIPQMELKPPEHLKRNIERLLKREGRKPCLASIAGIGSVTLTSWKNALFAERMERKTRDVWRLLAQRDNDWNIAFYITLFRAFGSGLNSDAFERLAAGLPWVYILKHRGSLFQLEALIFGQAGFLDDDDGRANQHYRELRSEYLFLRRKLGLEPVEESMFKLMRVRPANSPHRKLAQLAAIWFEHDLLFSKILDADSVNDIAALLRARPSPYWEVHYHFRDEERQTIGATLGEWGLNTVVINAVVPTMFAFGRANGDEEYCERAMQILENLPAESNRIVETFGSAGLHAANAADSQALIQLDKEYCSKQRCLSCRIGFRLLQDSCPFPASHVVRRS
jgi:hypothetical protein